MLAALLAYQGIFACEFVTFDDRLYVYENPLVTHGLSARGWNYAWTTFDCSNWHPLTWLSLQADATLWGGSNAAGFHATNLALHLLNVGLVFLVLSRMTGAPGRTAMVVSFWGVHPLHVESVAWVAERKDVLSTFGLLLTMWAYVDYAQRPSRLRYLLVVLAFAFGLLAKPMLVTLPLLLLLLDFWPLNRAATWMRLIVEKLPLLAMALALGIVTVIAQRDATSSLDGLTWPVRVANLFQAYAWYLEKTFVPVRLTVFYPHPGDQVSSAWAALCASGLLAVTGICAWCVRTRPHLLVGWLWFVIALLPVIGLLQVGMQAYADRYAYIPHLGLFVLLVWEGELLCRNWKIDKRAAVLCAGCLLGNCGLLTHRQVAHWRNSEALWTHALAVNPDNYLAHQHLADVRQAQGRCEDVIAHLERGLSSPQAANKANGYWNWGRCLVTLGRSDEAEERFRKTLETDPEHVDALESLISLRKKLGRTGDLDQLTAARDKLLAARAKSPSADATTQIRWGLVLARQGRIAEALPYFERAAAREPWSSVAHHNLGMALAALERRPEAKTHFLRAVEIDPKMAAAHFRLAEVFEAEGNRPLARQHFLKAWELNPQDAEAQAGAERTAR